MPLGGWTRHDWTLARIMRQYQLIPFFQNQAPVASWPGRDCVPLHAPAARPVARGAAGLWRIRPQAVEPTLGPSGDRGSSPALTGPGGDRGRAKPLKRFGLQKCFLRLLAFLQLLEFRISNTR